MHVRIALLALPFLAACDGSGSDPAPLADDQVTDVFNEAGPVVNACLSSYYLELVGVYSGEIQYASRSTADETACVWNVEIGIASEYRTDPQFRQVCDLSLSMTASTVSGGEACGDVGAGAELLDDLASSSNVSLWRSPPWPIEALAIFTTDLSAGPIYPVGRDIGTVSSFDLRFDGQGGLSFPQSAEDNPEWSGVLLKQ